MRLLSVGETAVLAELGSLAQVMGVQALLRREAPPGVIDVVAAAQTVLVTCDSPASLQAVRTLLLSAPPELPEPLPGIVLTINTQYDGADLTHVAGLTGLSIEALVSWHSGQQWLAAFGGFAPGFMYLSPTAETLNIPRRPSPRTVVPAGSVAVGGEFSAVYPGPSPGGWQLLGRCSEVLWNAATDTPALMQPGDAVQFVPVRELVTVSCSVTGAVPAAPAIEPPPGTTSGLKVLAPGAFTTVQDLGRPGFAHLGVTASGALDRAALRRANRMVGNSCTASGASHPVHVYPGATHPGTAPGAAGLEMVMAGLQVQAIGSQVVAVAGTGIQLRVAAPEQTQRTPPANAPFVLLDGEILSVELSEGTTELRSYLAVRGGFAMPAVLGSRATDVLSGLGPAVVATGAFLPVGQTTGVVGFPEAAPPPPRDTTELRFIMGPRHNWFTAASLATLENQLWQVSAASNRIGLRLEPIGPAGTRKSGAIVERTLDALSTELPSEGMSAGAIQVPPSGMPVIFLADHPVTGGYPVVGVVLREDLGRAAGLAPGALVQFSRVEPAGDGPRTSRANAAGAGAADDA